MVLFHVHETWLLLKRTFVESTARSQEHCQVLVGCSTSPPAGHGGVKPFSEPPVVNLPLSAAEKQALEAIVIFVR